MTGAGAWTTDDFLGGRLVIRQPAQGHRAGSDAVLLAAAVPACAGERVVELGTGAGVALLALMTRVAGLAGLGLDIDPDAIALAEANAARNGLEGRARFAVADLRVALPDIAPGSFDHALANPPYFVAGRGSAAASAARRQAREAAAADLVAWVKRAADLLCHRGMLTLILRTERLGDALAALAGRFGGIEIIPLRTGARSDRVVIRARKGTRAPLGLAAEIVLQRAGRYTETGEAVLRGGAALRPAAAPSPP